MITTSLIDYIFEKLNPKKEKNPAQIWHDAFVPPKGFTEVKTLLARGSTVYIKKENREQVLRNSGIIIQDSGQSSVLPIGRIVAVGPKVPDLKPGMRCYYNFYANNVVFHEGIEYLMISEIDVFALLQEEDIAMEASVSKEGLRRRDLSVDEMPDADLSKEEKQEFGELMDEKSEQLRKELKKKIISIPK